MTPKRSELVVVEADPAGGCLAFDFEACTAACGDHECLEWCAGSRCAELAVSLGECIAPAEPEFLAKHPEPEVEMLPPGPDVDPEWADVPMPDPESEEAWMEWEQDKRDASGAYWSRRCEEKCIATLTSDAPDAAGEVCLAAGQKAEGWGRFTPPAPPAPSDGSRSTGGYGTKEIARNAGILGTLSGDGAVFGAFMGSYLRLDREALGDFAHASALAKLLHRQPGVAALNECIPELKAGDEARRFKLGLRFDASGFVTEARAESDSREASCVAEKLAGNVRLPARALDELSRIFVDVSVSAPMNMFGGAAQEDVWGGLVGTEVGEAYGVGGLGLVGSGEGGGGTGEGTIGIGSYGGRSRGGGSGGGESTSEEGGGGGRAPTPTPPTKRAPKKSE